MITPHQAAQFAKAIYNPITPNTFSHVVSAGGITAGIADLDEQRVIALPGSECGLDWARDFCALQHDVVDHPDLGIVHAGMWQGMDEFWSVIKPYLIGGIVICAHSLGCAHAAFLAGLCATNGIPMQGLYLFAPPKCSYAPLRNLIAAHVKEVHAYRNGSDPVPKVPITIPLIENWVSPADLTYICFPPPDVFDWFAWHSIELYSHIDQ